MNIRHSSVRARDFDVWFGIPRMDKILQAGNGPKMGNVFLVLVRPKKCFSRPLGNTVKTRQLSECFSCPGANVFSGGRADEILAGAGIPNHT
jgi:hypothetical protein